MAHQARTIEELSEQLEKQWKLIDLLKAQTGKADRPADGARGTVRGGTAGHQAAALLNREPEYKHHRCPNSPEFHPARPIAAGDRALCRAGNTGASRRQGPSAPASAPMRAASDRLRRSRRRCARARTTVWKYGDPENHDLRAALAEPISALPWTDRCRRRH